jgi:hypothetical protein
MSALSGAISGIGNSRSSVRLGPVRTAARTFSLIIDQSTAAAHQHYHFKVFKPLQGVVEEEVPPAWYREALAVTPGIDCGCCSR